MVVFETRFAKLTSSSIFHKIWVVAGKIIRFSHCSQSKVWHFLSNWSIIQQLPQFCKFHIFLVSKCFEFPNGPFCHAHWIFPHFEKLCHKLCNYIFELCAVTKNGNPLVVLTKNVHHTCHTWSILTRFRLGVSLQYV